MATTNNIKILNKDYLAEQLYNYHKKYVASSINGIETNKQNNLEVVSNHLTWENNNILGVNILNDSEANKNDYLVLENKENGSLSWKTPITEQENLEGSESLVTGKAVFNFVGSTNINTLGTIKEGTWEAGDITLNGHNLTVDENGKIIVGNFEINQEEEVLKIKYADGYLNLSSSGELGIKSINVSTSLFAEDANIFNLTIGDNIKISDFEIKQEGENLQIGSEFLTLDPFGKLETMDINNTVGITTTELTVRGYYFMLGDVQCTLAREDDFKIDSITGKES